MNTSHDLFSEDTVIGPVKDVGYTCVEQLPSRLPR